MIKHNLNPLAGFSTITFLPMYNLQLTMYN